MTREVRLWKYLSRVMGNMWVAQRHEDKYATGIPDVSYVIDHHGWIELKSVQVGDTNRRIRVPHFTSQQRNWLKRFGQTIGCVWLLIQVNEWYILMNWASLDQVGHVNLAGLIKNSSAWWKDIISPVEFVKALQRKM